MEKYHNLTIITRTSARPNSFARLVGSISLQTYKHIKHIVLCDNESAANYTSRILQQAPYPYQIETVKKTSNNHGFYNLYLNHGIKMVDDGYILIIDDDDYILNNKALENFWKRSKPEKGFYIVQFLRGLKVKPQAHLFSKISYQAGDTSPIIVGKIGTSCAIFKQQHVKNACWNDMLGSDFLFIRQLAQNNNYTFIPVPIVQATAVKNGGIPNDIFDQHNNKYQ